MSAAYTEGVAALDEVLDRPEDHTAAERLVLATFGTARMVQALVDEVEQVVELLRTLVGDPPNLVRVEPCSVCGVEREQHGTVSVQPHGWQA